MLCCYFLSVNLSHCRHFDGWAEFTRTVYCSQPAISEELCLFCDAASDSWSALLSCVRSTSAVGLVGGNFDVPGHRRCWRTGSPWCRCRWPDGTLRVARQGAADGVVDEVVEGTSRLRLVERLDGCRCHLGRRQLLRQVRPSVLRPTHRRLPLNEVENRSLTNSQSDSMEDNFNYAYDGKRIKIKNWSANNYKQYRK